MQQHRAEVTAHDEKGRHPETVDDRDQDLANGVLPAIRDNPKRWAKREGGVQNDSEQHGDGAQRVEVGSPIGRGVWSVHAKMFAGPRSILIQVFRINSLEAPASDDDPLVINVRFSHSRRSSERLHRASGSTAFDWKSGENESGSED